MKAHIVSGVLFLSLFVNGMPALSRTGADDIANAKLLKGYVRRIAGETLDYNCFNPLAKTALLTRCTTGSMAIEWATEPIPSTMEGPFAYFVWVASYSTTTSTGDRAFDVFLNHKKTFVIRTYKNRTDSAWTLKGEGGAELTFKLVAKDLAGDANGYMYLKVPVPHFKKGEPLDITVVGENARSNDWYMTFMYDMKDRSVEVVPVPFLRKANGKVEQIVFVGVNFLGHEGRAWVSLDNGKRQEKALRLGFNEFEFAIPAVSQPRMVNVAVGFHSGAPETFQAELKPVTPRTIYLLPHSHHDIGYTAIQTDVLKKQVQNIRDALTLIKKTAAYPPEARFRWNEEVLWGVEEFLREATPSEREEFVKDVKDGSLGLEGLYLNMLTGLMRPEEFYQLTALARRLEREDGVTITSAMLSDVPGMTWNMIPTLAQAGIKYFSCGPNGTYNGGDRTGFTNRSWADRPFYWVSPSGREKILYWMTGFGYGSIFAGMSAANTSRLGYLKNFTRYTEWLDNIGYPYDMIQMRHTINGDNGTVDPDLPDYVKNWNATYVSPKIVIATTEQLFSAFEKKYGKTLPSFTGDLTPYWEDGAASTARELGLTRKASERLVQAGTLYALFDPKGYDAAKFYEAWKNVLLFDEHTWGAWNSTTEPDSPFVIRQWDIKKQFALDAASQSEALLAGGLAPTIESTGLKTFDIVNTQSWVRTDVVVLPAARVGADEMVVEEDGKTVLQQRLTDGDLAFQAADVPALGTRRYTLVKGAPSFAPMIEIHGSTIVDDNLEVTVDSRTGAISHLILKDRGVDLVDSTKGTGLNAYLYVDGFDPREALPAGSTSVRVKEEGPLLASLLVTSEAPGCNSLTREVTVVHGTNRVDLTNTIDKKRVRTGEAVHVAFPFQIADPVVRVDEGFALVRPEADQLAGSCKDYYSAQRWVDVANQDCGVLVTVDESPLVEVGSMHSELPASRNVDWKKTQESSPLVYSYVMNNYWYTNYKADQEGASTYHYSLEPHALFHEADAVRHGIERSQPLRLRPVVANALRTVPPFRISSKDVIASAMYPCAGGSGLIVRLYNASGRPEEASVLPSDPYKAVYRSSPFEEKGERVSGLLLLPREIVTVRIE
jgi:alpha-mannosidase